MDKVAIVQNNSLFEQIKLNYLDGTSRLLFNFVVLYFVNFLIQF